MLFFLWILSIVATPVIASSKNFNVPIYIVMALFLGPIALILVALVPAAPGIKRVSPGKILTLEEIRGQLELMGRSVQTLQQKLLELEEAFQKNFEHRVVEKQVGEAEVTAVNQGPAAPEILEYQPAPEARIEQQNVEVNFASNWLNKIGMVIFALGIGFLISYTFKSFGPFLKIAFGYVIALGLFGSGNKLERNEKLRNYGRVLLGGAWAVVYFTTYAMYHFPASRIVNNQFLNLCLLALVASGMILHAVRYRSQSMTGFALFVAYLTSMIGQVGQFTFISCLILAVAILFLLHSFRWTKLLILGILFTYGIHYYWNNGLPPYAQQQMSLMFLSVYWLVFFLGSHFVRVQDEAAGADRLSVGNFVNFFLYSMMAFPLASRMYPNHHYWIVMGIGFIFLSAAFVMKVSRQTKMGTSDLIAGVLAITYAFYLRYPATTALVVWFIEVPFLVFSGFSFKEKALRGLGYFLTVAAFARLAILLIFRGSGMPDILFFGILWQWHEFVMLVGAVSMGASCFWVQREHKKGIIRWAPDQVFDHILSGLALLYGMSAIWSILPLAWEMAGLLVLAMFLLVGHGLGGNERLRYYCYLLLMIVFLRSAFFGLGEVSPNTKWFILSIHNMAYFGSYFYLRALFAKKVNSEEFNNESRLVLGLGHLVLLMTIFKHIPSGWMTLAFGLVGVVLVLTGLVVKDRGLRGGGFFLFGVVLLRIIVVDLAQQDIIFKIVSFIVVGVVFLAVSFIYNKFNVGEDKN